jgi:tmRNA-binding protein
MAHTFKITIDDDELRAFNLIVPDADEWVTNAALGKVRKCLIYVAQEHAKDFSLLDASDLAAITQMVQDEGLTLVPPEKWSKAIQKEIAKRTKMKSRKERDEEQLTP